MALKFKLDSLEGIDPSLHPFYEKRADGRWTLLLDENPVKATVDKLRQERDELEKALRAREKSEADAKAAKEREEMERRGEYEKLRAADLEALKKAEARIEALEAERRDGIRDRAAEEAIIAANGIPKALLPHLRPILEVIPDGESFKVVVKGSPEKKLQDFVTGLRSEMPWGFNGTGASGSGAPASGTSKAPVINDPNTSPIERLKAARRTS